MGLETKRTPPPSLVADGARAGQKQHRLQGHQWLPWWFSGKESICQCQETRVQSLGWEDPLEEEMGTQTSILAWKNPMDRGACPWASAHGVAESDMTEHMHVMHPQESSKWAPLCGI